MLARSQLSRPTRVEGRYEFYLEGESSLFVVRGWLEGGTATDLFRDLANHLNWKKFSVYQHPIYSMGDPILSSQSHNYQKLTEEWHSSCASLCSILEHDLKVKLDSAWVDYYHERVHHVSRSHHECKGDRRPLVILSLGVPYYLSRNSRSQKDENLNLELGHGDLLVILDSAHESYFNQLPSQIKLGPSIAITFRNLTNVH